VTSHVQSAHTGGTSLARVYAFGIGLCLLVSIGLSFASSSLLPFVAALVALGIAAGVFLARPTAFLVFVLLGSAISGLKTPFDLLRVGSTDMTVSGLRWIFVAGFLAVLIVIHLKEMRQIRPYLPMTLFIAAVLLRWTTAYHSEGLKDVLFYTLPWLCGFFVAGYAARRVDVVSRAVGGTMIGSVALLFALYVVLFATGNEQMTLEGPYGVLAPRGTSLFLLTALAASLAIWRAPISPRWRGVSRASALLALGLIAFTMSRTAAVVGILLLAVHRVNPNKRRQLLVGGVMAVIICALLIAYVPAIHQRFFFDGAGSLSDSFTSLNTMGRAERWSYVWDSALEQPLLGWGPGNARIVVADVAISAPRDAAHPHNEYLQAFHDLGAVGVVLLMLAWFSLVHYHWRGWRDGVNAGSADSVRWNLAAFLAVIAVLLTSITDNTLHYAFVVVPTLAFSGLAVAHDRFRQSETNSR